MARFISILIAVATLAISTPASAEAPEPRDPYWSAGLGIGLFIFLPSLRAHVRYALDDVSFEAHLGVFAPAFAIGEFVYEVAIGPRFHFLKREKVVGFLGTRVGFWDIGPPSDEDERRLAVNELDRDSRYLNPFTTVTGGADFFTKRIVFSAEVGGGVLWGQRFNFDDEGPVLPLFVFNGSAGWMF